MTAYLDALNAHDCDTAAALTVAGAEEGAGWCRDVASLNNVGASADAPRRIFDQGMGAGSGSAVANLDSRACLRTVRNSRSVPCAQAQHRRK